MKKIKTAPGCGAPSCALSSGRFQVKYRPWERSDGLYKLGQQRNRYIFSISLRHDDDDAEPRYADALTTDSPLACRNDSSHLP